MSKSAQPMTNTQNQLSFEAYYGPLHQELMNYARRLAGGDVQRAHDVVQDATIKALRAWDRFVPTADAISADHAFRGWMYKIVLNTYMRHWRATRTRPEILGLIGKTDQLNNGPEPRDAIDAVPDPSIDAHDFVEGDAGDEVLEAIARLSPMHRQVIEMSFLREMSLDEIVVELGIPKVTIATRLNRAKAHLKKYLKDYARESYGFRDSDGDLGGAGERALEAPQVLQADADGVDRVVTRDDALQLSAA